MNEGDIVKNRETGEIGIILVASKTQLGSFCQVRWAWDGHTEYTHCSKLEALNAKKEV